MDRIHLMMPMAGGGVRFEKEGFEIPKPLIQIAEKPFFYWAVRSVTKYVEIADLICIVLKEHVKKYHIDVIIKKYFPNVQIIVIDHILNGAVLTCLEGVKTIQDDMPILINDCDHAFICNEFYEFCRRGKFNETDGALLTFLSSDPAYSYALINMGNRVLQTVEKEVISDQAICGAYYFKNAGKFIDATRKYIGNCQYEEFFISGIYNTMIQDNYCIKAFRVDKHISFGTPMEYMDASQRTEEFEEWS